MSQYSDNNYKFAAILNRKIELPKLLNALAHIAAGLGAILPEDDKANYLQYIDGSNSLHPAISRFPFIILEADNSNQIRILRRSAISLGILCNDFTHTMIGSSADQQLSQTKQKTEEELEYYGIVLYGPADQLQPLTKKFSIYSSYAIRPGSNGQKQVLMEH